MSRYFSVRRALLALLLCILAVAQLGPSTGLAARVTSAAGSHAASSSSKTQTGSSVSSAMRSQQHTLFGVPLSAQAASPQEHGDNSLTCPSDTIAMIKQSLSYTIRRLDGTVVTVSTLAGAMRQGDTVVAHFTIAAGCANMQLSLASYKAPQPFFDAGSTISQTLYASDTGDFAPGTHTLTVSVPGCDYQVDFVTGGVLAQIGPVGSDNFYGSRRIENANGGANSCATTPDGTATATATGTQVPCEQAKADKEKAKADEDKANKDKADADKEKAKYYSCR